MSNTLELWPRSSLCLVCCVLSCVCAWLYAFRLLVTGCCCRERRLPWQASHSPHPHLPSGLGWSQVNSWAWSYTRWKGKLGREPVSWAWWVLGGWKVDAVESHVPGCSPFTLAEGLPAGCPQLESSIFLFTSSLQNLLRSFLSLLHEGV